MISMEDIEAGKSYACRFKATVMLDTAGNPAPNLSDRPLAGPGTYKGLGVIKIRDTEQRLVEVEDVDSKRTFVVPWEDCWDVDTVEWVEGVD